MREETRMATSEAARKLSNLLASIAIFDILPRLKHVGFFEPNLMMRQSPDTALRKMSGFGWNRWPGMTAVSQMSSRR